MPGGAHLKEEDELFSYIIKCITQYQEVPMSPAEVFAMVEGLLQEHKTNPAKSRLRRYCPQIQPVFLDFKLVDAFWQYDAQTHLAARRFVPPTFAEIRRIFNLATVHAVAPGLKLCTLDADDTIYGDGLSLTMDSPIIPLITKMLKLGVHVSLVTAAGYPGEPQKYEMRLAGLLRSLAFAIECGADPTILSRFHIMGGECNYMLEPAVTTSADGLSPRVYLREIPDDEWKDGRGVRWDHDMVKALLDEAEAGLRETAEILGLDVLVIRKERAVGIIPNPKAAGSLPGAYGVSSGKRLTYEVLEEAALAVQARLKAAGLPIPHCAFNGGNDVFIDVGHKALGIRALQARVGATPEQTLHAGDRFTRTGNDARAREVATALWVDSPQETEYLLTLLIHNIRTHRAASAGLSLGDAGALASVGGAGAMGGGGASAHEMEALAAAAKAAAAATAPAPVVAGTARPESTTVPQAAPLADGPRSPLRPLANGPTSPATTAASVPSPMTGPLLEPVSRSSSISSASASAAALALGASGPTAGLMDGASFSLGRSMFVPTALSEDGTALVISTPGVPTAATGVPSLIEVVPSPLAGPTDGTTLFDQAGVTIQSPSTAAFIRADTGGLSGAQTLVTLRPSLPLAIPPPVTTSTGAGPGTGSGASAGPSPIASPALRGAIASASGLPSAPLASSTRSADAARGIAFPSSTQAAATSAAGSSGGSQASPMGTAASTSSSVGDGAVHDTAAAHSPPPVHPPASTSSASASGRRPSWTASASAGALLAAGTSPAFHAGHVRGAGMGHATGTGTHGHGHGHGDLSRSLSRRTSHVHAHPHVHAGTPTAAGPSLLSPGGLVLLHGPHGITPGGDATTASSLQAELPYYGITAERAQRQADEAAREMMRSHWESTGGVVVGEVRPAALVMQRGMGGASSFAAAASPQHHYHHHGGHASAGAHLPTPVAVVHGPGGSGSGSTGGSVASSAAATPTHTASAGPVAASSAGGAAAAAVSGSHDAGDSQ